MRLNITVDLAINTGVDSVIQFWDLKHQSGKPTITSSTCGRGFESWPGTRRKNSGHVSHTYVPLFTKQYKLVPAKGR